MSLTAHVDGAWLCAEENELVCDEELDQAIDIAMRDGGGK